MSAPEEGSGTGPAHVPAPGEALERVENLRGELEEKRRELAVVEAQRALEAQRADRAEARVDTAERERLSLARAVGDLEGRLEAAQERVRQLGSRRTVSEGEQEVRDRIAMTRAGELEAVRGARDEARAEVERVRERSDQHAREVRNHSRWAIGIVAAFAAALGVPSLLMREETKTKAAGYDVAVEAEANARDAQRDAEVRAAVTAERLEAARAEREELERRKAALTADLEAERERADAAAAQVAEFERAEQERVAKAVALDVTRAVWRSLVDFVARRGR